jgi:hypothetical protein
MMMMMMMTKKKITIELIFSKQYYCWREHFKGLFLDHVP